MLKSKLCALSLLRFGIGIFALILSERSEKHKTKDRKIWLGEDRLWKYGFLKCNIYGVELSVLHPAKTIVLCTCGSNLNTCNWNLVISEEGTENRHPVGKHECNTSQQYMLPFVFHKGSTLYGSKVKYASFAKLYLNCINIYVYPLTFFGIPK